jgi:hypothetical protein
MKTSKNDPDMLPEYDFSGARRSPYAPRYALGTNVAVLAPDVAKHFSNSEQVNQALRSVILSRRKQKTAKRV